MCACNHVPSDPSSRAPRPEIVLRFNACSFDYDCPLTGKRFTAGHPLSFTTIPDHPVIPDVPVSQEAAFKFGFTMSAEDFRKLQTYVYLGMCSPDSEEALRRPEDDNGCPF